MFLTHQAPAQYTLSLVFVCLQTRRQSTLHYATGISCFLWTGSYFPRFSFGLQKVLSWYPQSSSHRMQPSQRVQNFPIMLYLKQNFILSQFCTYSCFNEGKIQGVSNMTGTDLCLNKPHCAAAVRPWESKASTSTLPPARVRTCSVLSGSC